MGRKSKLTPEIQQKFAEILRKGGTVSMACGMSRINSDTFYDWIKRGRNQDQGIYRDFVSAVEEAQASAKLLAVRTIRLAMVGGWFEAPVYDKDGNPIPLIDPATGEQERDEKGRPKFMTAHQFKQPNENIAMRYLEHTDEEFGGGVRGAAAMHKNTDVVDVKPDQQGKFNLTMDSLLLAIQFLFDRGVKVPGYEIKKLEPPASPAKNDHIEEAVIVGETKTK